MTTRIVFIRHAKPLSEGYAEDALRPISVEGRATQRSLTEKLKERGITPTQIWTSPLLRAQQSGEVMGELFGVACKDEPALGVVFDEEAILMKIPSGETIFLVGHAPSLGEMVNKLVGEDVLPTGLSKSTAAVIDFEEDIDYGKGTFIDEIRPL